MGKKVDDPMSTQRMKQTIRSRILSNREALPAPMRTQFSTAITERILQMPEYQAARVVMGYMNFGTEFESEIWVRQALLDGKKLWLPKVNRSTNELDVYRVTDLQNELVAGIWNIREPMPNRCLKMESLESLDFILMPGVAFGRDGARLGYGGGFYDKLVGRINGESRVAPIPVRVAGAYSLQLEEDIPQELTDRKVQWLVTENETIDCRDEVVRRN